MWPILWWASYGFLIAGTTITVIVKNPEFIENRIFLCVDFVIFIKPFNNDINLVLDLLTWYVDDWYVDHMTFVNYKFFATLYRFIISHSYRIKEINWPKLDAKMAFYRLYLNIEHHNFQTPQPNRLFQT